MTITTAPGFDYGAVPADVAAEAREVAALVRQAHARTVETIIAMGRELLRVKGRLDHGQFGRWLDAEFGAGARTAQNYMTAAERFAGKSETVSYLPTATVYQLAAPSTPERVRQEVVSLAEAGSPLPLHEVDLRIKRGREGAREAKRIAAERESRTPEGRAKESAAQDRKAARDAREADARQERHALAVAALADFLKARLGVETAEFLDLLRATEPTWGGTSITLRNLIDGTPEAT